jgi:hypothetical protein
VGLGVDVRSRWLAPRAQRLGQVPTVERALRHALERPVEEAGQRGCDVGQADWFVDHPTGGQHGRRHEEEGDPEASLVEQQAMGQFAVLAERLAVVADHGD